MWMYFICLQCTQKKTICVVCTFLTYRLCLSLCLVFSVQSNTFDRIQVVLRQIAVMLRHNERSIKYRRKISDIFQYSFNFYAYLSLSTVNVFSIFNRNNNNNHFKWNKILPCSILHTFHQIAFQSSHTTHVNTFHDFLMKFTFFNSIDSSLDVVISRTSAAKKKQKCHLKPLAWKGISFNIPNWFGDPNGEANACFIFFHFNNWY